MSEFREFTLNRTGQKLIVRRRDVSAVVDWSYGDERTYGRLLVTALNVSGRCYEISEPYAEVAAWATGAADEATGAETTPGASE